MPPLERRRLELKEPTYMNLSPYSSEDWLTDKQTDDGAEGLWRIHDKLYDLHEFVDKHPGGKQWLELTKGTDITESFESHHQTGKPEKISDEYFIRVATTPRNSPFTFREDGFYRALKRRVSKTLEALPRKAIENRSKRIMDSLVLTTFSLTFLAAYWDSYITATVAGVVSIVTAYSSHNFFHKKDNWRMHWFSLSLMSVRDWRISHALSHHAYTNSFKELGYVRSKQFPKFTPDHQSSRVQHCISFVKWLTLHMTLAQSDYVTRVLYKKFTRSDLVGFATLIPLSIGYGGCVLSAIAMWAWIVIVGSFGYWLTNFTAAHHHPTKFEEDGMPRQGQDWGLAQINVSRDSKQAIGGRMSHTLHHLFPNLDKSVRKYLIPDVVKTCAEFGMSFE